MEKLKFIKVDPKLHKKLKQRALDKDSTIKKEVNEILENELGPGENID